MTIRTTRLKSGQIKYRVQVHILGDERRKTKERRFDTLKEAQEYEEKLLAGRKPRRRASKVKHEPVPLEIGRGWGWA